MKTVSIFFLGLLTSLVASAQIATQGNVNPGIRMADSLFMVQNWARAKQTYESALKDSTRNSLAWNRLGYSNYNLKLYDAAINCFQKSLTQTPPAPLKTIVYSRMARIYAIKNDKLKAFMQLDSAVGLGYSNIAEMDTLAEYNKIRNDTYFKHLRDRAYINGNPCMGDAHAREFDYWIGEWDVHPAGSNVPAGHSLIQLISGGCALLENWDSPSSNGKSINFIDPVNNKWKQSWAGNYTNGIQEFVNGEYKDSAMRFTFESKDAQGNKIIGRFIFFNEGPNQVRQFNETSADGGKTWTTNYDLVYIRKNKK